MFSRMIWGVTGVILAGWAPGFGANAEEIRIGMIGLDTSHCAAFTKLINDSSAPNHVPGGKVVAAYKGGSPDLEASYSRVDQYTKQLEEEFGVEIVDSIEKLCTMVDAIMLTSVDGRPHLEQVKPVFAAGLPVYIDKPLAGSLKDAIEISRLGKEHNVPWFSSSSYRYYASLQELLKKDVGEIRGVISYGPCHLEPSHPDLFWYGVHPTEALYAALGRGCQRVTRISTPDTDIVSGLWDNGRTGILYGLRTGATPHQVTLFGTKAVAAQEGGGDYAPLVVEVMKFFQTRIPPIDPEETIELFAFMEAADESKRRGGAPVTIQEVMEMAGSK